MIGPAQAGIIGDAASRRSGPGNVGPACAANRHRDVALLTSSRMERVRSLTPQQSRVFDCLAEGLSNKQIALRLGIHESTVKAHASAVFAKLGCSNRIKVALLAMKCVPTQRDEGDCRTTRIAAQECAEKVPG